MYWNRKHGLNCHRMKPALFSVLCEIKEKTGKSDAPCAGDPDKYRLVYAEAAAPCHGALVHRHLCSFCPLHPLGQMSNYRHNTVRFPTRFAFRNCRRKIHACFLRPKIGLRKSPRLFSQRFDFAAESRVAASYSKICWPMSNDLAWRGGRPAPTRLQWSDFAVSYTARCCCEFIGKP